MFNSTSEPAITAPNTNESTIEGNSMDNWQQSLIINLTDDGFTKEQAQVYVDDFVQPLLDWQKQELLEKLTLEKRDESFHADAVGNEMSEMIDKTERTLNLGYNQAVSDLEALKANLDPIEGKDENPPEPEV